LFAIAGLDGRLGVGTVLVGSEIEEEQQAEWRAVWSRQTPHPFFAAAPFSLDDAVGTGGSGFAACGWSGVTWLVRSSTSDPPVIMVFDAAPMLAPPLRGFVAGRFGKDKKGGEPCLFYSCADGRIRVFHDLAGQLQRQQRQSAATAEKLLLDRGSGEVKALVKAWCDLHLGSGGANGSGGNGGGGSGGNGGGEVAAAAVDGGGGAATEVDTGGGERAGGGGREGKSSSRQAKPATAAAAAVAANV
jgi:hypothetical protein